MRIGRRIKDLRTARKLSMRALARELNVDHCTIVRWERDERTPRDLSAVAGFFGLSLSQFYDFKAPSPTKRRARAA